MMNSKPKTLTSTSGQQKPNQIKNWTSDSNIKLTLTKSNVNLRFNQAQVDTLQP